MLLKPNGHPLRPQDAEQAIVNDLAKIVDTAQARFKQIGSERVAIFVTCPNAKEAEQVTRLVQAGPKLACLMEYLNEQAARAFKEGNQRKYNTDSHLAYRIYQDAFSALKLALDGGSDVHQG